MKVYEDRAKDRNYSSDYISINRRKGAEPVPALNNLVLIAEKRAFEIQQIDYADRFSVMNTILDDLELTELDEEINAFFNIYDSLKTAQEKLHFLCEVELTETARKIIKNKVGDNIKNLLTLDKDRLKALGYNPTYINKELKMVTFSSDILKERIFEEFSEGNRLAKSDIKERLAKIYNELDYQRTAKANDIEEWFEIKSISITIDGKRVNGFELLKKKS